MDLKPPNRKELRDYGLVMGVAITLLGCVRWWWHDFEHFPVWFVVVAAVFAAVGLIVPEILRPVYWVWMRFALGMNWVVTRVLLITVFVTMIIPGRLILSLRGKDPLKRAWDPDATSYWEEPEDQPEELDRYFNQF